MISKTGDNFQQQQLKCIASILLKDKPFVDVEPEFLLILAEKHGLLALLNSKLSTIDDLSSDIKESFRAKVLDIIAMDIIRSQELCIVFKAFSENNIQFIVFKGEALAYTHYQESYERIRCDTDVLFQDQHHADKALNLLINLGFQQSNTTTGNYVGFQFNCIKPLKFGGSSVLDCHIKFNDHLFYSKTLSFNELKQQAVSSSQPFQMLMPAPVHAALISLMHRTTTLSSGQADRLIWLYDNYLLFSQFTQQQWQDFISLAKEKKICGTCVDGIRKTEQFFPLNYPANLIDELEKYTQYEPFNPSIPRKRWFYYYHSFKEVEGLINKTCFIKEHIFPGKSYMMKKYELTQPLLLPWFYLLRIIKGIKRYF